MVWAQGSPLQRHRGEARKSTSCTAALGETQCPMASNVSSGVLEGNPKVSCNKGMRYSSSRGLAEPAALQRVSSTREHGATRHHSFTEGERMLNMSSSPSPKKG